MAFGVCSYPRLRGEDYKVIQEFRTENDQPGGDKTCIKPGRVINYPKPLPTESDDRRD